MKEVPNHSDELVPQETAEKGQPEIVKADIEKMLDEVDFNCLKAVFQEKRKQLGIKDAEQVNFVGREAIVGNASSGLAHYYSATKRIGLKYSAIERSVKDYAPQERFFKFLGTLTHEECHAASYYAYNQIQIEKEDVNGIITEKIEGYRKYQQIKESGEHKDVLLFDIFNEAITEMLAEEVFLDYCKRKAYDENVVKNFLKKSRFFDSYKMEHDFYKTEYVPIVEKFITLISVSKKQGYADIWRDLQRGYFEGKDLYTDQMTSWLNKIFGNDFLENLATLAEPQEIERFSTRLNKALDFVIKNLRTKEK